MSYGYITLAKDNIGVCMLDNQGGFGGYASFSEAPVFTAEDTFQGVMLSGGANYIMLRVYYDVGGEIG